MGAVRAQRAGQPAGDPARDRGRGAGVSGDRVRHLRVARNAETAGSYANLVAFPTLFLSGVFFGIDGAAAWPRPITRVLPLSYLGDAPREPMTRGRGIEAIWTDLLVVAAVFLEAMVVAVRFFRWGGGAS